MNNKILALDEIIENAIAAASTKGISAAAAMYELKNNTVDNPWVTVRDDPYTCFLDEFDPRTLIRIALLSTIAGDFRGGG